jgi:hypothetical protein
MVKQKLIDKSCLFNWGGGEPTICSEFEQIASFLHQNGFRQAINSSGIEFSGKPAKVPADKVQEGEEPFDVTNPENIEQVLIASTQNAYNRYLKRHGEEPEMISPEDVQKTNFGKYSGRVAQTYFKSYQAEMEVLQELSASTRSDKMVGVDENDFPVFEHIDEHGNYTYYTYNDSNFSGMVFGEDDQGRQVYVGDFGVDDKIPTSGTEEDDDILLKPQTPLKKPDVAPEHVTEDTGCVQLTLFEAQ